MFNIQAPLKLSLSLFQRVHDPVQLVEQAYFYERKELEEYVKHVGIHPDTGENVSESDIRGVQVPEHSPGLLEIESDFLWEHPVHYPSYQKVR